MSTVGNNTSIINNLIEINNDRVAGFEKVIADIDDENIDLKSLFQEFAQQSRKNSQELSAIVGSVEELETGNSVSGALHRAWIDVKSLFGGSDRASILSEAERGEDAIKKAYQEALSSGELLPDVTSTVSKQAHEINSAHDKIKALRDIAKA
ncbi:ferritin-like domain-containing protein [Dyadobacter sediminis]|uniref:PA2169 family four-helix-bundle protein n=1 Tax=Dyadobacter sediminis TaxID=1493691 RepID=A0A5R9KI12_9BACT|nr:PA2169 family four-helix-bundle protein [Dyadobacter sediminis]TLU95835.1 PA2169 family four-helix-bundle protein [Dyadobacter sediminis]GGB76960.1 chemotaxis protein [Dyadobacter sediminis]